MSLLQQASTLEDFMSLSGKPYGEICPGLITLSLVRDSDDKRKRYINLSVGFAVDQVRLGSQWLVTVVSSAKFLMVNPKTLHSGMVTARVKTEELPLTVVGFVPSLQVIAGKIITGQPLTTAKVVPFHKKLPCPMSFLYMNEFFERLYVRPVEEVCKQFVPHLCHHVSVPDCFMVDTLKNFVPPRNGGFFLNSDGEIIGFLFDICQLSGFLHGLHYRSISKFLQKCENLSQEIRPPLATTSSPSVALVPAPVPSQNDASFVYILQKMSEDIEALKVKEMEIEDREFRREVENQVTQTFFLQSALPRLAAESKKRTYDVELSAEKLDAGKVAGASSLDSKLKTASHGKRSREGDDGAGRGKTPKA